MAKKHGREGGQPAVAVSTGARAPVAVDLDWSRLPVPVFANTILVAFDGDSPNFALIFGELGPGGRTPNEGELPKALPVASVRMSVPTTVQTIVSMVEVFNLYAKGKGLEEITITQGPPRHGSAAE